MSAVRRIFGEGLAQPLWLLPFGLLVVWLLLRARAPGRRRTAAFAPLSLADSAPLPATWRTRLLLLPASLELLALLGAATALARPYERMTLEGERRGVSLYACIDTSSSMAATDLGGPRSRLAAAKSALSAFVEGRPDDRVGLLRFARYADVVCPPTLDHAAFLAMLDGVQLVQKNGPEDATGIGAAVARCVQSLATSPEPSRVVVLVTDGEENVATAAAPGEIGPLQAAQLAQAYGVRVHTLFVGRADDDGQGPGQVEELARRTEGSCFFVADEQGLERVWAEIGRLEPSPAQERVAVREDRHAGWIAASLALWLLAAILRRTALEVLP